VDGRLALTYSVPGSKDFPIGKGGNYRPLTLNYSDLDGTSTVTAEQFESGFDGTFPAGSAQLGTRFWRVTESGSSSRMYNITLDGTGFLPTGDVKILKYNAPSTNNLFATTGTVPNYTASGLTSFSDFALGECTALPQPGAFTTSSATVCKGQTGVVYTVPNDPNATSYTWTYSGTGATFNSTTNSVTINFSSTATSGTLGVKANGCGPSSTERTIDITVNTPSVAPTTATSSANNYCSDAGGTLDLTASGGTLGTGAVVKWYTSSCGGTSVGTGSPLTINKPTTTTTYYARYEGDCNTTSCKSIMVTVKTPPTVTNYYVNNVSNTKEVTLVYGCTTPELKVAATGSGFLTYKWYVNSTASYSGSTQVPLAILPTYNVPPATGVGTYYYYAEVTGNGCTTKSDFFKVEITQQEADADNEGNAYYTGPAFVWKPTTTSNTATVTLSAFLKNKSNEDCGDIATARVTFQVKSSAATTWTNIPSATNLLVSYVDPNNPAKGGTAAAIVQLSIPTSSSSEIYDIKVIIGGNYKNSAINSQNGVNVVSISQLIVGKLVPGWCYWRRRQAAKHE
jgi:hypothetical protein